MDAWFPKFTRFTFVIYGVMLLSMVGASRVNAAEKGPLQAFFAEVTSFRADFTQTVYDENRRQLQSTSGTMVLKRPGRFRWDYATPFEQHIVADGKNIYIHDVDLEQVTVKSMEKALGDTPAQLLSTTKPLSETFHINADGEQQGLYWYELVPKVAQETSFQRMRLGFTKAMLTRMELEDALGNITLLEFAKSQRNPTLDDKIFEFKAPAGADIIGPDS